MGIEKRGLFGQAIRTRDVIVIQPRHQLPAGRLQSSVEGARQALTAVAGQDAHARVPVLPRDRRRLVRRLVVHDEQFEIAIRLAECALHRIADETPVVERRNHHRDECPRHDVR